MKTPSPAPLYATVWLPLCEEARDCGYALALHGTMGRDMDLVACPWTDEAEPAEELVRRLADRVAYAYDGAGTLLVLGPAAKPHGRRVWTFPLWAEVAIDLSVMPRSAP